MVFSASYLRCVASQERVSESLGGTEAGSSWVVAECGIRRGTGRLRTVGRFAAGVTWLTG